MKTKIIPIAVSVILMLGACQIVEITKVLSSPTPSSTITTEKIQSTYDFVRKELTRSGRIISIRPSSEWGKIIIGQTTMEQVKSLLGKPDQEYNTQTERKTYWITYEYFPFKDDLTGQNYKVVIHGIQQLDKYLVAAIKIEYYPYIKFNFLPKLKLLVEKYGKPDFVVWKNCWSRFLIWQKYGISAEIDIGDWVRDKGISFSELQIINILYTPPVSFDIITAIDWPNPGYFLTCIFTSNPCRGHDDYPMDPFNWSIFSLFIKN